MSSLIGKASEYLCKRQLKELNGIKIIVKYNCLDDFSFRYNSLILSSKIFYKYLSIHTI